MPPMYLWEDTDTGYQVEVLRGSSNDYLEAPKDEELPESERGKSRKWKKLISPGIRTVGNGNWQPSKGYH